MFTVTITNNNAAPGVSTASGGTVKDVLPAGLSYVSDDGGGSFNSGTGVWTVGTLAPGASATLHVTAKVTTGGTKTNYTQVTTANQIDVDSTPNNNPGPVPSEDDEAAVSLTPPAQLGDFVWVDTNRNGQQDSGEPAIPGVTVNLLNSTGTTVLQTTTTDASGLYLFTVAPGTYEVQFVTPAGAYDKFTTANSGSDVTDSDASHPAALQADVDGEAGLREAAGQREQAVARLQAEGEVDAVDLRRLRLPVGEPELALVGERRIEAAGGAGRLRAQPLLGRAIGEQRHLVAGAAQTVSGEQPGDAGADDGDTAQVHLPTTSLARIAADRARVAPATPRDTD